MKTQTIIIIAVVLVAGYFGYEHWKKMKAASSDTKKSAADTVKQPAKESNYTGGNELSEMLNT